MKFLLLNLLFFIIATFGGAYVVKWGLDYIYRKVPNYLEKIDKVLGEDRGTLKEVKVGRIIGILERAIIYILISTDAGYSSLGYIFAAKSVTRFKAMDKKEFSEYYLLGTLISYFFVILIKELGRYLIFSKGGF